MTKEEGSMDIAKNRKAIIATVKQVYFVVVGLAIISTIIRFIPSFNMNYFGATTWLFLAFLITIIRFSLGGVISFSEYADKGAFWRFLLDLHFYFITMVLFFMVGYFIANPAKYIFYFKLLLFWDLIWVFLVEILLGVKGFSGILPKFKAIWPWPVTDLIILAALFSNIPWLILLGAIIAAVIDYTVCRKTVYWGS